MGRYTLIVETEERVLKIDGAVLDQDEIPPAGGIIRFRAERIIDVRRG